MPRLDPFTQRRVIKFIENFRAKSGQLPTIADFAKEGIEKQILESALKDNVIEEFYVTLTNGTIVKGYKIKS